MTSAKPPVSLPVLGWFVRDRRPAGGLAGALAFLIACTERAPARSAKSFETAASVTSGLPAPSAAPAPSAPAPSAPAIMPAAPSASELSDGGASAQRVTEPALVGTDGKPLPQTEDAPRVDSPAFLERMQRLVTAIRTDDPEAARPVFFPVIAYEQVKDIAHPARDWERRLYSAFERNVHEYHRSFGASAGSLSFVGVDVPATASRWMKPGSEGNRVGYHRVLRSRLRVKDASGRERALEITSMISWRGEWYVVHLHGFK